MLETKEKYFFHTHVRQIVSVSWTMSYVDMGLRENILIMKENTSRFDDSILSLRNISGCDCAHDHANTLLILLYNQWVLLDIFISRYLYLYLFFSLSVWGFIVVYYRECAGLTSYVVRQKTCCIFFVLGATACKVWSGVRAPFMVDLCSYCNGLIGTQSRRFTE